MKRSSQWAVPLTLALLLAIAGSFVGPAHTTQARHMEQTSVRPKQIVYLDGSGQILIDSFIGNQPTRIWQSGQDNRWENLVAGDFNGDGTQEFVATRVGQFGGGEAKGFSPAIANTWAPTIQLQPGYAFHLLAAGDFQGLGRDQLAVSYTYVSYNFLYETIMLYAWDKNGVQTGSPITVFTGAVLSSMAAGDLNRDGKADLVFTGRGESYKMLQIKLGAGGTMALQTVAYSSTDFCDGCEWWATQIGNMDKDPDAQDDDHPGNELVLSRNARPPAHSIDLEYLKGINNLREWGTTLDYAFWPSFRWIALGDADGDSGHDAEIFALRNPEGDNQRAYLVELNPAGPDTRLLEQKGDYRDWQNIAAGDVNGDGLADIVTVGPNGYRVYVTVAANNNHVDVPVTAGVRTTAVVLANLGLSFYVSPLKVDLVYVQSDPGYITQQSEAIQVGNVGESVIWTATPNGTAWPDWLKVTPTQSSTPSSFTVSVDPAKVPAGVGDYSTQIKVATTATSRTPYQERIITVTLHVWAERHSSVLPIIRR